MTAAGSDVRTMRLNKLATPSGQFAILALDHVRSFATTVRPNDPDSISPSVMAALKERLIGALAPDASAILIDPVFASSRAASSLAPLRAGLIVGIEDGDYEAAAIRPRLLPGWTVDRAARLGADAVKISFQFDPDDDTSAAERFVRETVRECGLAELPLFCEPLVRATGGPETRRRVLEGIRRFGSLGADVLKVQFPNDTEADRSRDSWVEACGLANALSPAPWALLSEGRDFAQFQELLGIACDAGASGFLAGRAIWGGERQDTSSLEAAAGRLTDLRSIAVDRGLPWTERRNDQHPSASGGDA